MLDLYRTLAYISSHISNIELGVAY